MNNKEMKYSESTGSFSINFGGLSSIDAEIFSDTIKQTIEITKKTTNLFNPDAFVRLEIKANKPGSFETFIDTIVRYADTLFTKDNIILATAVVGGVVDVFTIKKHLKGEKAKEIVNEGDTTKIINVDNAVTNVDSKIADAYFKDAIFENCVINVINNAEKSGRDSFSIKSEKYNFEASKEDYEQLREPIYHKPVFTEPTNELQEQRITRQTFPIKELDLVGSAKWKIIFYGRIVSVKINDTDFLNNIRNGKILVSGGYKMEVDMTISQILTPTLDVEKVDYIVDKVHKIIPKEETRHLIS